MAETVLVIEDEPMQQHLLQAILGRKLGFEVHVASDAEYALAHHLNPKAKTMPDIVLLDMDLPGMHGLDLLERLSAMPNRPPVIVLTAHTDLEHVVRAMKLGAADYIAKPVSPERLGVSIRNALRLHRLSEEVARLKQSTGAGLRFTDIVGHDGGLKDVIAQARKAAGNDLPVLITGETGTGKELFARALHTESRRRGGPFIAVNCGAIPDTLVESTLFGHEKGAFTGAVQSARGKFREAEGGTLFLDEIGELSAAAQVRLLRALQQREVEPVGLSHPVPVDVRVIAATHRDLQEEVRQGRFRDDLYFRLDVLALHLPALRDRPQDIPALCESVINELVAREGLGRRECGRDTLALLRAQPWPGNVRELQNTLRRALAMSESPVLKPEDIRHGAEGARGARKALAAADSESVALYHADGHMKTLEEISCDAVKLAVGLHNNNLSAAASALGIARSTCYRKLTQGA